MGVASGQRVGATWIKEITSARCSVLGWLLLEVLEGLETTTGARNMALGPSQQWERGLPSTIYNMREHLVCFQFRFQNERDLLEALEEPPGNHTKWQAGIKMPESSMMLFRWEGQSERRQDLFHFIFSSSCSRHDPLCCLQYYIIILS